MSRNFPFISKKNPVKCKIIWLTILFLFLGTACFSGDFSPVSVEVAVDRSEIRTGEEISIKISVIILGDDNTEGDPCQVILKGYERLFPDFELTHSTHTSDNISKNKFENISIYRLKGLKSGAYETENLSVYLDDRLIATSAMIYLDVYASGEDYGLSNEKIRLIEKYPRYLKPLFISVTALLTLFCAFRIRAMVKGRKSVPGSGKYKVTGAEAKDILKEYSEMKRKYGRVSSPEDIREFYYDMSRILRDYVDRIYGIDLMESTPEEAADIFMLSNEFTPSIEKRIVLFMEKCDSIKYSRKDIGKTELRGDYEKFQRLFKRVFKDIDSDTEGKRV